MKKPTATFRSYSPNVVENPRYEYSLQKSPNPKSLRAPLETFNPLSPDNVEYLVNKRLIDSNYEETRFNSKNSIENQFHNPKALYNSALNKSSFISQDFPQQENLQYSAVNSTLNKGNSSRAYVNAMKALQMKIKSLEEENKGILQKFNEKDVFQNEEINNITNEIKERTRVFEGLERNLKEKLSLVEKEKNDYEKKCISLQKENEKLKIDYASLDKKFEEEFKVYLTEKAEIKSISKLKEDRLEILERENNDIKREIEDLRRSKQAIHLDFLNNSEENQKLVQELQEKLSLIKKELEGNLDDFKERELELRRELEIQKLERNSLEKELSEMRIYSEKQEIGFEELRHQLSQKENELILLREKTKSLIKEKEALILKENEKNKAIKKKEFKKINEEKSTRVGGSLLENESLNIKGRTNRTLRTEENNNQVDKDYQMYTLRSQTKNQGKMDMEQVVSSIIQLEKELVKYIERYKFLSSRLAVNIFGYFFSLYKGV